MGSSFEKIWLFNLDSLFYEIVKADETVVQTFTLDSDNHIAIYIIFNSDATNYKPTFNDGIDDFIVLIHVELLNRNSSFNAFLLGDLADY